MRSKVHALQGVVHGLGDVEELVVAGDDAPFGVEADVAHQRDEGVQHLGDAAAVRRGVDVEDARALERPRQALELGDDVVADDGRVVGEGFGGKYDVLHTR